MSGKASIPKASAQFAVPGKTDPEFAALPGVVRKEVRFYCRMFTRIWNERPITAAWAREGRKHGLGAGTIRRKFYALKVTKDWRVLISRSRVPVTPLSFRVPLPSYGIRVHIVDSGPRHCLIQILPSAPGARRNS